ncbi:hypothetical protein S225a_07330 [Candidatus Brocadiaceae bacterium S225]|nr:hypothetical protein S225a_07330 [Candidatus Brocadiaceae bacterium S225]
MTDMLLSLQLKLHENHRLASDNTTQSLSAFWIVQEMNFPLFREESSTGLLSKEREAPVQSAYQTSRKKRMQGRDEFSPCTPYLNNLPRETFFLSISHET